MKVDHISGAIIRMTSMSYKEKKTRKKREERKGDGNGGRGKGGERKEIQKKRKEEMRILPPNYDWLYLRLRCV